MPRKPKQQSASVVPENPGPPIVAYSPPPAGPEVFDAVLQRLTAGSREDFLKMLANWTLAAPGSDPESMDALRALAKKFPDRYMQGMTMVARMSGMMGDTTERHGGTTIIAFIQELRGLSDAEVYRRARESALAIVNTIPGGMGLSGPFAGSSPAPSTIEVIHGEVRPALERQRASVPPPPPSPRDSQGGPPQAP